MSLKQDITQAMKDAMRAGEKDRLVVIRMALAAFKQVEVDERIELDETRSLALLDKMVKQRRESIAQYEKAGRTDLADIEHAEIAVLAAWLPEQLTEAEITQLIDVAVAATGAESMKDMGKLMADLRPKLQGKADMSAVSELIKARLN